MQFIVNRNDLGVTKIIIYETFINRQWFYSCDTWFARILAFKKMNVLDKQKSKR